MYHLKRQQKCLSDITSDNTSELKKTDDTSYEFFGEVIIKINVV